jgi:hypothetical protein
VCVCVCVCVCVKRDSTSFIVEFPDWVKYFKKPEHENATKNPKCNEKYY